MGYRRNPVLSFSVKRIVFFGCEWGFMFWVLTYCQVKNIIKVGIMGFFEYMFYLLSCLYKCLSVFCCSWHFVYLKKGISLPDLPLDFLGNPGEKLFARNCGNMDVSTPCSALLHSVHNVLIELQWHDSKKFVLKSSISFLSESLSARLYKCMVLVLFWFNRGLICSTE